MTYKEKKKIRVELKHQTIADRKLLGHIDDADIDRLISIKNNIYTTFNYKNHNLHLKSNYTGPEDKDFGYWKAQDFKDQLKANERRDREQQKTIKDNLITTELNLPSIQSLIKDYTANKSNFFGVKDERFKNINNEKQY